LASVYVPKITAMVDLQHLEKDLSKYSMEDELFLSDYSAAVTPSLSASSFTPEGELSNTSLHGSHGVSGQTTPNGLIHGHIHNFENFTYIHGHIHTNDADCAMGISQKAQRRRSSHHRHNNDFHSLQFSDCQHFEFLNCHDAPSNQAIDESLVCDVHENCKPKIVEVCCDSDHDKGVPFKSSTVLTNHDHPLHNPKEQETKEFDFEKVLRECGLGECIDVKCDLDTCDIDELYCKYCENMDDLPGLKSELMELQDQQPQEIEELQPQQSQKRQRDDEERSTVLHHLHHHHHHQHPENHHHHHIQLHDHQQKKIKGNDGSELINFEWNFKNQRTKCEWENCSTLLDNSLELQNHIVETHLLQEYPGLNPESLDIGYECEWKNCDYSGFDLFSLMNHINATHGVQSSIPMRQLNEVKDTAFPTPSEETQRSTKPRRGRQVQKEEEQTICKWLCTSDDGATQECSKKFASASELTDHLINYHVGAGKSEYTCLWIGCDRNQRNFNQRQKIIRHLHVHTRYKPFKCDVCGHSFAVESMLEQHMRTHSGEKPYECKECGKHFATSSSLSIHMRTHTGEKPLVCKYPGCSKRFSESSNLTKHMKTHEKTYKCDCCSKSFGKERQLESHMARYHDM
jgi:hypothetical protein